MKNEKHENIDDEVDEDDLYELDKLRLDENKRFKCEFKIELKNINDIKILNSMNSINDNEVNNIDEYNLLHNTLNTYKHTKI